MIEINVKFGNANELQAVVDVLRALPQPAEMPVGPEGGPSAIGCVRDLIEGVRAPNPIKAIKAIRALTGLELKESKDLYEGLAV